ncbi:sulfotransferase [Paraburkholderia sp. SG-MS1]|uniref:sulfotransferase n=1 Tax=Paraburkholderia sp. SG-MS1 TaxID=2023741 RepID=UPI001EEB4EFC|nr:sulfotransferase [Paraburkholderia sp. SG-MS1]
MPKRSDCARPTRHKAAAEFSRRTLGAWVERFYREELEITAPIWGGKHPSYADPTGLSGRLGSVEHLPRSGSRLLLIPELSPQARFIHIHRDPRQVANSLLHKRWIGSIDDGVRVWGQYVGEVIDFFEELPDWLDHSLSRSDRRAARDGRAYRALPRPRGRIADQRFSHCPARVADTVQRSRNRYRRSICDPDEPAGDGKLLALAGRAATHLAYAAA